MAEDKETAAREIRIQRCYYAETAYRYDSIHGDQNEEHSFALQLMLSIAAYLGIQSILDIGSGTGRAHLKIKSAAPEISVTGIEPSPELRSVGYSKGLTETELIEGDAMNLRFSDGSFDLVCEFGALHQIPVPSKAVSEMIRVSRSAVFISDCNNFGQGGSVSRLAKQAFNAIGLWPLVNRIKTRGKGYTISEDDGLAYSYSAFNDYRQIKDACASVHLLNTLNGGPKLYRTASHVALLGFRQPMTMLSRH